MTCRQCGSEIQRLYREGKRRRVFCSQDCYHKSKKGIRRPYLVCTVLGHQRQSSALRGRKQSPEHVLSRAKSTINTLTKSSRTCIVCKEIFNATRPAQKYCSGKCWNI